MRIDVFTLFPEWFEWFSAQRHVANALAGGHSLGYASYRDHTPLKGGQVDDTPFGGGAGMVLRVDVVDAALRERYGEARAGRRIVALTPGGRRLDDALVTSFAEEPELTLLCGRYEGFDERIVEHLCTDAVSVGPFVLAGGELAAMTVMDAVFRKLPGALGHADSAVEESFSEALEGLPEYPHYTRPASYRGWDVPEVLLSGHHANVAGWRRDEARRRATEPVLARERELHAALLAGDRARVGGLLAPYAVWPDGALDVPVAPDGVSFDVHGESVVAHVDGPEGTATDTWVRHGGAWLLAARHVTPRAAP
jgi:tRNA (guanine37-N1)-methyltransferase